MAYDDLFRLSVHAVFIDENNKILQLKSTYKNQGWGLPGGALEPGETIHDALIRECREELGVETIIHYMSGMYYHKMHHSHACIFKCEMPLNSQIILSQEHSDYRYFSLDELSIIQRKRIDDCINFDGKVHSAAF